MIANVVWVSSQLESTITPWHFLATLGCWMYFSGYKNQQSFQAIIFVLPSLIVQKQDTAQSSRLEKLLSLFEYPPNPSVTDTYLLFTLFSSYLKLSINLSPVFLFCSQCYLSPSHLIKQGKLMYWQDQRILLVFYCYFLGLQQHLADAQGFLIILTVCF